MQTIAAIGVSTDADYDFLAPLAALFWRDVIEYSPRVFLVGSEVDRQSGRTRVSLDAYRFHQIDHAFVGRIEGHSDGTVAQNVRFLVAADSAIPDEQWITMSDADLFPLRREFYHQHDGRSERAVCLYSNGDHFQGKETTLAKFEAGENIQALPTCHIMMRAREWRSLYNPVMGDVVASTKKLLAEMQPWINRCKDPGLASWCRDMWYATVLLCRQSWFPEEALLIPRHGHPPMDRYDRGLLDMWERFDPIWTDAHVLKKPHEAEQWRKIWPIINCLMPQHATWARWYREEYVK